MYPRPLCVLTCILFFASHAAGQETPPGALAPSPDTPKPATQAQRVDSSFQPSTEGQSDEEGSAPPTEAAPGAAAPGAPAASPLQANTARGEGRRNENVQVNLVDNNAQRDANLRIGATATIVDEFRVERGYFASEFGSGSKGPIHSPFQNGLGMHGALFWNHDNSITRARTFFQAGSVQPARQNQYGAVFTTNLWRGAFFSFTGSQDKNRGMVNGNIVTLLPDEHTPLATDPATRALVQTFLDAFPLDAPNRPDIAPRALNLNRPQTSNADSAMGQFNQKIGTRDSLSLRYGFTGQVIKAFQFVTGQNPDTTVKSHASRLTWNRAWNAGTVSDFSFGFDRQGALLVPAEGAVGPIFLSGLQLIGPFNNIPLDRAQNQWLTSYSMQQRRGRHVFAAGASLIRRQSNGIETDGHRRTLQFRNDFGNDLVTNLRLGLPSQFQQSFGNVYRGYRNWDALVFAGDRWSVSNALTLTFGVRWEPTTRPVDVTGHGPLPFDSDWNNVGGNFGFAYRLPGGLGVLRGAGGAFFSQIFVATYGQDRLNPPGNYKIQVPATNLLSPLPPDFDPSKLDSSTRTALFILNPDLAVPYSYQYNFSWENDFRGWRLQLGYVGSRSHKLFGTYVFNRAAPIAPMTVKNTNDRRPDPTAFDKLMVGNTSNGYYDAGRVTLIVPNVRGLTLSTSYWFSKSIDLGGDFSNTAADPQRFGQSGQTEFGTLQDMKGLSNFDQPHSFLLQASYDIGARKGGFISWLYRNWTLNSVLLMKSGTPFDINSGSDGPGFGNVDGINGDRVHILDPSILGATVGHPDTSRTILSNAAFAYIDVNAGEVRGNIGRNAFRKGKIGNLNASMQRSWTLPHDLQMTLRAESINFTNTPQFAEPGRQVASPNFGQITNTLNDGRTFRFTLRFTF